MTRSTTIERGILTRLQETTGSSPSNGSATSQEPRPSGTEDQECQRLYPPCSTRTYLPALRCPSSTGPSLQEHFANWRQLQRVQAATVWIHKKPALSIVNTTTKIRKPHSGFRSWTRFFGTEHQPSSSLMTTEVGPQKLAELGTMALNLRSPQAKRIPD